MSILQPKTDQQKHISVSIAVLYNDNDSKCENYRGNESI